MGVTLYFCLFLCSSIPFCFASYYDVCDISKCGSFHFGYPFGLKNSGCGDPDFQLHCDYQGGNPLINIGGDEYRVLEPFFLIRGVNNNSMKIINNNLWRSKCDISGNYSQFWLPASHFQIADTYTNITIWGNCHEITGEEISPLRFGESCGNDWYYKMRKPEKGTRFCKTHLQLPIQREYQHFSENQNFPWEGFEVTWHVDTHRYESCSACLHSYGRCGYEMQKPTTFFCFCPDGNTYPDKCPDPGNEEDTEDRNMSLTAIGYFFAGVAVTAIAVTVVLFSTYDACKKRNPPRPPPQISQGNGNDVANPATPSSAPKSHVFTFTENSSSVEMGV